MTALMTITVWQPWASLIIGGWKPYEFRPRPAPKGYAGKRIGIHASARHVKPSEVRLLLRQLRSGVNCGGLNPDCIPFLERLYREPDAVPRSAILGTALLGRSVLSSDLWPEEFANDSDRMDKANWALPLSKIERFEPVVPSRGYQGWWPWNGARP